MSLQVSGALLTDVGRQRTVNEDWCGSFVPDERDAPPDPLSVWVVADGVSRFGARARRRAACRRGDARVRLGRAGR